MSPRLTRPTAGFTIVEVMMAATILVVGFLGLIQAVTIGSEMLATARRQTLAAQIIGQEIETLRLTAWSSLPAAGSYTYPEADPSGRFGDAIAASGLTVDGLTLTRTIVDLDVDSDTVTDLKEVRFTLRWAKGGTAAAPTNDNANWLEQIAFSRPSSGSRTYTREMSTYLARYGLSLNLQR